MHTETVTYDDNAGGVVTKYDYGADGAIGYWYDSLNRTTRKFYRRTAADTTDGWNVYYTYKGGTEANQTTSMVSRLNYQFDSSNSYTLNYTYDNIGNITEVTDASGKTVGRYLYDSNGQLVLEEVSGHTKVYTYDTFGNILSETEYARTGYASPSEAHAAGMDAYTYTYKYTDASWKDLLTTYRGQTITYDAAGNPLSYYNGQSYTFTWEDGNQLASATVGGKTLTFEYNSDGIRTKKTIANTATYYYRLMGSSVVEMEVASVNSANTDRYVFVYDADGNPHEIHKYAAGATTPTKYFYVLNLQGDVIQLRDTSNAVVANYTYDAWGRLVSVRNASGATISDASHIANVNPIRYRGYFYDTETKLYYCNSRYYDPQIKRFINADVYISTGQGFNGFNMFTYCGNNPVVYADQLGERYCAETSVIKESEYDRFIACDHQNQIAYEKHHPVAVPELPSSETYQYALYDNDRFEDKTSFNEKLFSGEVTIPSVQNRDFGSAEITVWSGGWETDYIDVNLYKALNAEYSLTLDYGVGITASASLIETGVDFDIGSWNIDLSTGVGAGVDFYIGKKGITFSIKFIGISIRW